MPAGSPSPHFKLPLQPPCPPRPHSLLQLLHHLSCTPSLPRPQRTSPSQRVPSGHSLCYLLCLNCILVLSSPLLPTALAARGGQQLRSGVTGRQRETPALPVQCPSPVLSPSDCLLNEDDETLSICRQLGSVMPWLPNQACFSLQHNQTSPLFTFLLLQSELGCPHAVFRSVKASAPTQDQCSSTPKASSPPDTMRGARGIRTLQHCPSSRFSSVAKT